MSMQKGGGGKGKAPGAGNANSKKLFVGGLEAQQPPPEQSLRDHFSQFGTISELKLICDDAGLSKGYCFVTYETDEEVQACLANYEKNEIDGKWVDVKVSNPSDGIKPGDWYCPMCGDLVFAKRDACNSCGYAGPGMMAKGPDKRAGKPGDWVCPSCGDLVFSYRDKCNKCGQAKTDGVQRTGSRPGDWTCPNCGDLVFASKNACKMCGTPKPEGAGARSSPY